MREKIPTRETKSKNYSKHEAWENKEATIGLLLFPVFMFSFLFDDLF